MYNHKASLGQWLSWLFFLPAAACAVIMAVMKEEKYDGLLLAGIIVFIALGMLCLLLNGHSNTYQDKGRDHVLSD